MSTRVTANSALVEASGALAEAGAVLGSVVGTDNTQLGTFQAKTTLGRTTANGGTVVALVKIPLEHSISVRVTVVGRVVVVGATAAVGDTYTEVDLVAAKAHGGTASIVGSVAVLTTAHDTSQAGDTVVDSAAQIGSDAEMAVTVTQNGSPNVGATIDWVIRTETLTD